MKKFLMRMAYKFDRFCVKAHAALEKIYKKYYIKEMTLVGIGFIIGTIVGALWNR